MAILPGKFTIETLSISSSEGRGIIDISQIYQQINIFESILTPCITGYIIVTDTFNLISGKRFGLPIMGNEILTIEVTVPSYYIQNENDTWSQAFPNKITFFGRVTDIKNITLVNEGAQNYEIHFCSEELILDKSLTLSKSYGTKTYGEMVGKIFDENFNTVSSVEIEKTLGNFTLAIPNWNPIQTINWMASRSLSANNGTPQFFFYQSLYNDGITNYTNRSYTKDRRNVSSTKYWFLSLDELISLWGNDVRKTIFFNPANNSALGSKLDPESTMNFSNAMNYQIVHSFNTLENVTKGMFNSRMISHDMVNKTWTKTDYNYDKHFKDYYHLDPGKFFSGVANSKNKKFTDDDYASSHIMLTSTGSPDNPNYLTSISSARIDRVQALNNFRVQLLIPGDGLTESGDIINFDLKSREVGGNGQLSDQFYSGKYLVNSIKHTFSRNPSEYNMTLDCSKESLNQEVTRFTPGD